MDTVYIQFFIQVLFDKYKLSGKEQFNLNNELSILTNPVTSDPLDPEIINQIKQGVLERINCKESKDGAVLIPISAVSDPREHEEWYEEWLNSNNDNESNTPG